VGLERDAARIKIYGTAPPSPDAQVYVAATDPEAGWAELAGRGMTFQTAIVEIDQRENRLWSEGPGKATILMTKDMEGKATTKPSRIEIRWQNGMQFDGRRAVFRGNIQAQGPDDLLRCQIMIVKLASAIDFNAPKNDSEQGAADIAEIEFQEQVILNHRSRDDRGPTSHDRMTLTSFAVNQQTGLISGRGPGVIRSTRFGDSTNGLGGLGSLGGQQPAKPSSETNSKLVFVRTDFDGPISGNIFTRMLEFRDRVRMVFGPVDSWEQELDVNRPDLLPPESLTIECEKLKANEDPMATQIARSNDEVGKNQFGPIQLQAEGNVRIDGRSKTQARMRAEANTATYDRGKKLIILKGSPAILFLQSRPGEAVSPIRTDSVNYSLETGLPDFKGFQGAEINIPNAPQSLFSPSAARGPAGPPR
jgi:lipopolysaccharide export system protein LptA